MDTMAIEAAVNKAVNKINSPKGCMIGTIVAIGGMAASAPLFWEGCIEIYDKVKFKCGWREVVKSSVKCIPMLCFAASAVLSTVSQYKRLIGVQEQAAATIAKLSAMASTPAVTVVDKVVDKVTTEPKDGAPEASTGSTEAPEDVQTNEVGQKMYTFEETITGQRFVSTLEKLTNDFLRFKKYYCSDDNPTLGDLLGTLGLNGCALDYMQFHFENPRDAEGFNFHIRYDTENGAPVGKILWTMSPTNG